MSSLQHDSEAENAHLMSEHHGGEKELSSHAPRPHNRTHQIPLSKSSLITLVVATALVSTLVSGLALHFLHLFQPQQHSLSQPGTKFGSCGETPDSARAANCVFDPVSFSWLPPACVERELIDEFMHLRDWEWWSDENATTTVPRDEVLQGNHAWLYVTREYHNYHCTYMWRKLHLGLMKAQKNKEKRGIVDTYIGAYGHTAHCEAMLLGMRGKDGQKAELQDTDTNIIMKFPSCMWM